MNERNKIDISAIFTLKSNVKLINSSQLLQRPKNGTREATKNMIIRIDGKIAQLATLGLRPHSTMIGYRQELVEQIETGGPYKLRVKFAFLTRQNRTQLLHQTVAFAVYAQLSRANCIGYLP